MTVVVEDCKKLISQYLINVGIHEDKAIEISKSLAKYIESKQLKLLELVKALGDYLTADDDVLRPKAASCLSAVLSQLPKDSLSKYDIQVLFDFFTSRIDDIQSTKETLFGLSSLIEMRFFSFSNVLVILQLLHDYNPKQHLASTRYFSFKILKEIIDRYGTQLSTSYSAKFIETFIHVSTGEKDPRNLLLSFELNHKISSTFDIDGFEDDLFDVLFCYFPISFKPPKEDPYKITSDQLKESLRGAIASSSRFAKDSYPNLLEKLTSTSPIVKQDTLLTIQKCIENYGIQSLEENLPQLWNALKFEILHNDPEDDELGNYVSVLSIFKSFAQILSENSDSFEKFLASLFEELLPKLENGKHVKQTISIFGSLASANQFAFNNVIDPILKILLKNSENLNIPKQRALISNIDVFTKAYISVFGTFENKKDLETTHNKLLEFKDEILIFLGRSLMSSSKVEVSLRTLAVSELTTISTMAFFLDKQELSLVVQYFTETVLDDDNQYIFDAATGGLIQISKVDSQILLEVTFPLILSLLPDDDDGSININGNIKSKEKLFDIITLLSTRKEICDVVSIRLLNKLIDVSSDAKNFKYSYLISSTIYECLQQAQRIKQFQTDFYLTKSFPLLVDLLVDCSMNPSSNSIFNDNNIEVSADLINLIIAYSSKSSHQKLLDETITYFTAGTISDSAEFYRDTGPIINIFRQPTKLVNIFLKIIAAVDVKSTKFPNASDFVSLISTFIENNFLDMDNYTKIGYLQTLSIIINKWVPNSDAYVGYLGNNAESVSLGRIEIYTWIAKGFISKIDKSSSEFLDVLVSLLFNSQFGTHITKSFEVLVTDISSFNKYKKISNNNVRLLYKQKFFEIITPKLVDNFIGERLDLKIKSNFLIALSLILKHTKKEIVIPHLTSFFPLLLQSLDLQNSDVRYASLETILITIDEIPELVSKHLQTIIPKLIRLTKHNSKDPETRPNNPEIRLIALNCLDLLSLKISISKLIPYKDEIIQNLSLALDDPRRKVRKAAVDARQSYYELGRKVSD